MMRIVTHPQLLKDLSLLDPILDSPSWKTLMTVTRERERTRESPLLSQVFFFFLVRRKTGNGTNDGAFFNFI